ncbi:DUF2163 domain-containing protein [Sphingomonas sp. LHG3443-2]|uniref:DUF2163 domain-containing protein n=1 Tax=Sphingomonas sp. LHG3443-2 TaxID=2804639 RepID=UPI003CF483E9
MSQTPLEVTTEAYGWVFQRADGIGFATTSHDKQQQIGSMTLEANMDLRPSELMLTDQMYGSTFELSGGLSSPALTVGDLLAGRWNGAAVQLLASDWAEGGETIPICAGELGRVAVEAGKFSMAVEVLPPATRLPPCIQTSPECRAVLGDRQCRIDMRKRRKRINVVASDDVEITIDAPDNEEFALGRLRWISGANCGTEQIIISADGAKLRLQDAPQFLVKAGDQAVVRQGCDGRRATCSERFSNILNFRGEPDLPGSEILLRFPGA